MTSAVGYWPMLNAVDEYYYVDSPNEGCCLNPSACFMLIPEGPAAYVPEGIQVIYDPTSKFFSGAKNCFVWQGDEGKDYGLRRTGRDIPSYSHRMF
jgi:hypothetical protein